MQKPTPQWIRYQRQAFGFTQLRFAEKLGVCEQTVTKWESGAHEAPVYLRLAVLWLSRDRNQVASLPDDFPAWLKWFREQESFTLEQLALRLGVTRNVVIYWEQGKHRPPKFIMFALKWLSRTAHSPSSFASIEYNALHPRRTPKNEQFA